MHGPVCVLFPQVANHSPARVCVRARGRDIRVVAGQRHSAACRNSFFLILFRSAAGSTMTSSGLPLRRSCDSIIASLLDRIAFDMPTAERKAPVEHVSDDEDGDEDDADLLGRLSVSDASILGTARKSVCSFCCRAR